MPFQSSEKTGLFLNINEGMRQCGPEPECKGIISKQTVAETSDVHAKPKSPI